MQSPFAYVRPRRTHLARTWRRPGNRPRVFGHRGARHGAPENTFAAFDQALDEGADGIELDVRLDGDGTVIVLHDPDLTRVTGGADPRSVEGMTTAELGGVDVGDGQRVPHLIDVLDWAARRDTRVNVEVKSDVRQRALLVRRVARLVAARPDSPQRVLVSSFHPAFVAALARWLPDVAVAWLIGSRQAQARSAPARHWLGAAAIHPEAKLVTEALIAPWKAEGLAVNTWTVNEPAEALRLASLGVDTLISDNPGKLLAALLAADGFA